MPPPRAAAAGANIAAPSAAAAAALVPAAAAPAAASPPPAPVVVSLDEWLAERGLEQYAEGLRALGGDSVGDLAFITEADLTPMGMKPLHLRRLLHEVKKKQ